MLLIFKLLFAARTYYVTILICESKTQNKAKKNKNKRKPNELMTKTRLGTERETERRLPVSRNPENNVKRNILINTSWMEKS